jgi:hypothetical protein
MQALDEVEGISFSKENGRGFSTGRLFFVLPILKAPLSHTHTVTLPLPTTVPALFPSVSCYTHGVTVDYLGTFL